MRNNAVQGFGVKISRTAIGTSVGLLIFAYRSLFEVGQLGSLTLPWTPPKWHKNGTSSSNLLQLSAVQVAFGLSGNNTGFLSEFEVAMKSVLMNAPLERGLIVHVLADRDAFLAMDEIINRTELQTWKTRNPTEIHIYDISPYLPALELRVKNTMHFTTLGRAVEVHTLGQYFRLIANRIVPPTVEHLLYMDTDVVIMTNLDELWRQLEENHTALFHWGMGMCSGFVVMNVPRMEDIWTLAQRSPLANISRKYHHIGDQLLYMAVNITYPQEVNILPEGWDMTVTERWRPKYQPYEKKFPNIGMLHLNGGASSKEAYFNVSHSFIDGFPDTWGNAKHYATMPWSWARYQAKSTIPTGKQGYQIQIASHNNISSQ